MLSGSKFRFSLTLLFIVFGLVFASAQGAWGQNIYAKIQGLVSDPTGASVPGVKLVATNTGTGITYETTSGADGDYVFLQLPVGTYTVKATGSGFRTITSTPITLRVDQVYVLNIKMELGQVSETVTVEAGAVQVQTVNTQLGTVITGDTIRDLPLNGRNWTQLQQLQPGVMASSDRFGTYSTNGSQTQQNSFLINGQDSNDLPLNTPLVIPSPDAIGEFNMVTNTINPEYGRNSGAILNAVIRSGTNNFHGDAFEFYRDTFLNTKGFFQKTPSVFHQHQFGGTIGGPIWKDHTFFFFSYQGTRFRQNQAGGSTVVFSPAQRNGDFSTFDFNGAPPSAAGKAPSNPNVSPFPLFGDSASPCPVSGGVMCPAGTYFGQAYDNNGNLLTNGLFSTGVIPTEDFNAIAANLMTTFVPLPNASGNLFTFNPVTAGKADQYLFQIDHTFSANDAIQFYGFFQTNPTTDTLPFTGSTLPGFPEQAQRHIKQYTFTWNHTVSSNTLNEFRVGYTRFNFIAVKPINAVLPSSAGFNINPQNTADAGIPRIDVTGLFTLGFSNNGPQPRIDQTYQLTDNFSHVIGRHTLKFGFQARRFFVSNPFFFSNNGVYSFGGNGSNGTGVPGADFLLGIPDGYTQSSGGFIDASAHEFYTFAQDSWKATNDFTVNYGLAWQIDSPLTDHFNHSVAINCFRPGQQSFVFPTAPVGLVFPGDNGCTASGYKTGFTHFGPRLGLAWAPHASGWLGHLTGGPGKFSIRAGVGVYYNRGEEELTLQNLLAPPFSLIDGGISDLAIPGVTPGFASPFNSVNPADVTFTVYNGSAATNPTTTVTIPAATLGNKYPFLPPSPGSPVDFSFFEPFSLNVLDPNFAVPYTINDNVTIQRELPGQMLLTFGYVGSFGRHLQRAYELNPGINPAACAADPVCVANRSIQGFVAPQNFKYDPTVFASVGQQATDGTSHYNSFQASLQKRLSHGLTFLGSYTWAHSIDNGSSFENTSFGTRGTNPLVPRLNVGDSEFDARHRFVINYSYEIPVLAAMKRGALGRFFQGWTITGITTVQTGFPVNISNSGFTSLTCWAFTFYGCPDNADQVVAKVETKNPRDTATHLWFDPKDFKKPAFGTFGNGGRNPFHGPGIWNTDLAIRKITKITEGTSVELRLESYNTFNHTQFGLPNGNVNSSSFGRITTAAAPRLVQLAAKFYF